MHKTDPVVYMQRQKERGEREGINVLIENMVRKETTKLDGFAELRCCWHQTVKAVNSSKQERFLDVLKGSTQTYIYYCYK